MPGCKFKGGSGPPVKICATGKGSGGMLMPSLGEDQTSAIIYFLLLLWTFVGVAIVADVFMSAIERITSKKVTYRTEDGHSRTGQVWNPTVANLTLMALGSSAPEILLNVIGIFPDYVSSELGPSTIVGSAAFNLLVIIAVCVVSIPNGQVRKIATMSVYIVTASSSIFAYVWVLIMLQWISPNVVEWWEGVLTFMFFWILVLIAYLFDINSEPVLELKDGTQEETVWHMELAVRKKYGSKRLLTVGETATLMHYEFPERYSRAVHRSQAVGMLTGGRKPLPNNRVENGEMLAKALLAGEDDLEMASNLSSYKGAKKLPKAGFEQRVYTVTETAGEFSVVVKLYGEPTEPVVVPWMTVSGTAQAGDDFEDKKGVVEFTPGGAREQAITLKVNASEGDEEREEFYVQLVEEGLKGCRLVANDSKATISIIDVGKAVPEEEGQQPAAQDACARPPGMLRFDDEEVSVMPKKLDIKHTVVVKRLNGDYGQISCRYTTEGDTAVEDKDFEPAEGILMFAHGVKERTFDIAVKGNTEAFEADETFRILLSEVKGGATFDEKTDGGLSQCIQTVTIQGTNSGGIQAWLGVNWDVVSMGNSNYKDQICNSFKMRSGEEDDEDAPPGMGERVMHVIALPWKFVFSLIPPVDYMDGLLTFVVALFMIGIVTVAIGDLAELLGCAVGLQDSITAITLVALGTSLPDTFASRTAAMWEPTADSSIGNVTGSNSVNVFLGLGLPWMICSVYWWNNNCEPGDDWYTRYEGVIDTKLYPTGVFVVEAGSLATSVTTFCICGLLCIGTLAIRRQVVGGELGGPPGIAWASSAFFVLLWVVYVSVSIWDATSTAAAAPARFSA